jgi:hypothetical protein
VPLSTARIASIRPRGEYFSSPVTRNVGQCGRQRPARRRARAGTRAARRSVPSGQRSEPDAPGRSPTGGRTVRPRLLIGSGAARWPRRRRAHTLPSPT